VPRELPSFRLADYVLGWTTPEKCGLRATCLSCGSHDIEHTSIKRCTDTDHLCNARGWAVVPNNADVSSPLSLDIAKGMLESLNITQTLPWAPRQSAAAAYERAVRHFTTTEDLTIGRNSHLSEFAQYRHLAGRRDDRLRLDITISRAGILLVVLELKTTIRSDRARGAIRNLVSTLTEHSGADIPLAAVVTSEPLPSRLLAVVPHRGDTHALFHVARSALQHAITTVQPPSKEARRDQVSPVEQWEEAGKYVRDFRDLFLYVQSAAAS
jgi:hypothetical protein